MEIIKKIMNKTNLLWIGILLCLVMCQNKELSQEQKNAINMLTEDIQFAPDFSLPALNDSTYTLSELRGKVVIINFWATWCGPCRLEIPDFNELYTKHKEDGLEILGISISDQKKALKNFTKSYRVDYPLLFDSPRNMDKITRKYGGVYAVPTSYIIGRKGDIIASYPGAIIKGQYMYSDFIEKINIALKEKI